VALVLDCEGALYWPDAGLLAVSDLHLEKGSSFAARGVLLPPYDTATTLARIAVAIARYAPQTVVALGDSFHDGEGAARMLAPHRDALRALQRGRDWIWIAGNHDPDPAIGMGGSFNTVLTLGALSFRHEPSGAAGEIAGHLHPLARVSGRGCSITRRCFASDGMRLLMPAFGAFAGGLNVREPAFGDVFGTFGFTVYVLGEGRIYALAAARCLGQ
jgi:DNA ligase-associated metallophosphoesterase